MMHSSCKIALGLGTNIKAVTLAVASVLGVVAIAFGGIGGALFIHAVYIQDPPVKVLKAWAVTESVVEGGSLTSSANYTKSARICPSANKDWIIINGHVLDVLSAPAAGMAPVTRTEKAGTITWAVQLPILTPEQRKDVGYGPAMYRREITYYCNEIKGLTVNISVPFKFLPME